MSLAEWIESANSHCAFLSGVYIGDLENGPSVSSIAAFDADWTPEEWAENILARNGFPPL